jgi:outer membrane biosynthesis protein TonB
VIFRNCRENLRHGVFSRLAAVRRPAVFALIAVLGAAGATTLASCGGGSDAKLLPGATAQEINENLDRVRQYAEEGECVGASNEVTEVSAQVESLQGVDAKLKQALQRGAEKLGEVVAGCEEATAEATTTESDTTKPEHAEPPGQEKKAEKEREKEEEALEKEEQKEEKEAPPSEEPPAETPPSESGGTGAPGGVSPGAPAAPGGE